jgi:hypothetical protein
LSVAETVCPSVRGAEGIRVMGLLVLSGGTTAATVGFVAGATAAVAGLDHPGPTFVASVVGACAVADAGALRWRPARPLSHRRQVPQVWGRLFGARVAAGLYGARLGVGPLTILASWTWWGSFVVGASLGAWPSAAVGAAFAVTRMVVMAVAGGGVADGDGMQRRMGRLLAAEPAAAWTTVVALAGVAALR